MDNYIVINGKKAELTEEQLEKLGIKVEKKNPFDRVEEGNHYWQIDTQSEAYDLRDDRDDFDDLMFKISNYFNNKNFANQVALHEQLNRKLLKFAYDHKAVADWEDGCPKYNIVYDEKTKDFSINSKVWCKSFDVCFASYFVASKALNEVVKPFMKEHPDFVW